ncbi:hypothetical protein [Leucobacter chromiireducens]|uniref:Uncharacterized protein n=1 Tax=Leucobacter chromiireducens subsp. solipictus TaxID=398235 RepID=A0ABS1SG24_9MICO|nr:hypothetical protein [Leucobacter chromiireducens]MBL3679511.1 hypothetical protein [Leucobacter chromiireducens subsp. solipictus]
MNKPTRRLSAALATAVIAGAALLAVPATAHATDLDCESGRIVAPVSTGLTVYDMDGRTPLGSLTAPVCAVTGEATAPPVVNTAQPSFEVEYKGKRGLIEDFQVAAYPSVTLEQLDAFFAIPTSEEMPENWVGKLGGASSGIFALPAASGPFSDGPLETGMAEGTVYRSTGDLDLGTVGQSALAGTVSWQPIEHRGVVAWMASEFLVPLPTVDDRFAEIEIDGAGYTLYADPTDASPERHVDAGETFETTRAVAGWALTSDGEWLRAPSDAQPIDTEKAGAAWAKVKEKAGSAWDSTKEKASDLTSTARDKVAEKKASSKALTFGAMVTSTILSGIAAVLAILSLTVRRARGLALTTPAGIARTAIAFVAAPASLALSIAAVSTAPFVWVWQPILASAVALFSVATLYVYAARLRGGHAHESQEALVAGLRSPVAIGAGALTAALTLGASALAGLAWPAYVVAVLGSIAAYAGLALTVKRPPESTDTDAEQADTPDSEPDEAPAEAEPVEAE